jgi:predicted DNA-binding transcriptional regulator YafY
MANTSSRSLRLLSLLQSHHFWQGRDLAARLGVTARTLRRDIERLRALGYPVESHPGVDGGYQLSAGANMPPLLLDADEAVALAVGLHTAAHAGVDGLADSAVRALTKVLQTMTPGTRSQVDALLGSTVTAGSSRGSADGGASPETLTVISQACRDAVRVTFAYLDREQVGSQRSVEPYQLVTRARRWYLLAYDPDRDDWRTFRLDRISDARSLRNSFTPRALPSDDIGEYVRARIERSRYNDYVTIRVVADAATVAARIGRFGIVEPLDDTSSQFRMATATFDWVVFVLDQLRTDFTVLDPPALVEYLSEFGALISRATSTAGTTGPPSAMMKAAVIAATTGGPRDTIPR